MGQPVPELPVADVERAQQHYKEALGFEIGWLYPGKEIGAVSRGKVTIFFQKRETPFEAAVHWVFAEDIDASYQELTSSGANIVDPLETKPWGLRQFTVHRISTAISSTSTTTDQAAETTSGAHAMPHEAAQTGTSPVLTSTEAQLFVTGITASCDFYTGKLGFTVAFLYGDPPSYAQVTRDQARLNLKAVDEPVFAGDIREREHLLSASLTVATKDEIEPLFQSYKAAGAGFHQELKKEPWGAETFIVRDPDGNLILFAGPAD